jgi:hypothetical protein
MSGGTSRPVRFSPFGPGFLTTRSCGQCGAYGSQRGGGVQKVKGMGRCWVNACCRRIEPAEPKK